MLRRPSAFLAPSVLISKRVLPARRKENNEETISQESLKDRKLKPSLKGFQRSDLSRPSRSLSLSETRKQPMIEQIKKDILDYLDNMIESAEWLVLF